MSITLLVFLWFTAWCVWKVLKQEPLCTILTAVLWAVALFLTFFRGALR